VRAESWWDRGTRWWAAGRISRSHQDSALRLLCVASAAPSIPSSFCQPSFCHFRPIASHPPPHLSRHHSAVHYSAISVPLRRVRRTTCPAIILPGIGTWGFGWLEILLPNLAVGGLQCGVSPLFAASCNYIARISKKTPRPIDTRRNADKINCSLRATTRLSSAFCSLTIW